MTSLDKFIAPYTTHPAKTANPAKNNDANTNFSDFSDFSTPSYILSDAVQERAAILHHDNGIDYRNAEAVAYFYEMNTPHGIHPTSWQWLINLTATALDTYHKE